MSRRFKGYEFACKKPKKLSTLADQLNEGTLGVAWHERDSEYKDYISGKIHSNVFVTIEEAHSGYVLLVKGLGCTDHEWLEGSMKAQSLLDEIALSYREIDPTEYLS